MDVSLIKASLCSSVLLHRAGVMTNHPHRSECCGPRSGVLRVCACALRALRIQVYEWRERGWWEHSLLHSGTEQLKQMSLLERLDWRVRFHYSLIAINAKRNTFIYLFIFWWGENSTFVNWWCFIFVCIGLVKGLNSCKLEPEFLHAFAECTA